MKERERGASLSKTKERGGVEAVGFPLLGKWGNPAMRASRVSAVCALPASDSWPGLVRYRNLSTAVRWMRVDNDSPLSSNEFKLHTVY